MLDAIVIGKGLVGSAAARYLGEALGEVALIGPPEPEDWTTHEGVFASHYDQGRITRILDEDNIWAQLAARSIEVYGELEQRSSIRFHHAVGCLNVGFNGEETRLEKTRQVADVLNAEYERSSSEDLKKILPFLCFPPEREVLLERGAAGYINPRSLIAAQLGSSKAKLVAQTVKSLSVKPESVEVINVEGEQFEARKVLVAAGAYTNFLLPEPLDLRLTPRTILLAHLGEREAERLKQMPSVIFYEGLETAELTGVYALPPIRYPDGNTYIKIGGRLADLVPLQTSDELRDWFHSPGDLREAELLKEVLLSMIPGLEVEGFSTKPCVITATEHGRPYIDELIQNRLYVAAGGNGAAAKSSNEIGRLGAGCVLGKVRKDRQHFRAVGLS